MSVDDLLPEDDELLAAELAFGLLDEADRPPAERRIQLDAAFASAHRRWQDHAAGLYDAAGEAPPEAVWRAIQQRLPANDAGPATKSRTLRWWQASTGLATACALVLGIMSLRQPAPRPSAPVAGRPSPPLVAVLRGKSDAVVAISFDPTTRRLTATPSSLEVSPHAAELWVIPSDGKPRSLGVLAVAGPTSRVTADPTERLIQPGSVLAISVEPPGGSPTHSPTGAVVLTGKIEAG